MTQLTCQNCGGSLSLGNEEVLVGDGAAVVRRDALLRCEHCGTECFPGDELSLTVALDVDVRQQIDTVESGGTVVGVRIDLGD